MSRLIVSCINKSIHSDPHQRIRNIGGIHNGARWKHTEDDAISNIQRGINTYHVNQGDHDVEVIVAVHLGRKYLKTRSDGLAPNNLLSLPECP